MLKTDVFLLTRLYFLLFFTQLYDQLPFQKLTRYPYEVEDHEPYPCFPVPVPELEVEPEADVEPGSRKKRSSYFGPTNHKDDVYSIFKVNTSSLLLSHTDFVLFFLM